MSDDSVLYSTAGHTAHFKLNRPGAMNALTNSMLDHFDRHLPDLATNADIRVVVVTGKGRAFCAGADLKETTSQDQAPGEPDFIDRVEDVFARFRDLPKPTIAALNGHTLAGGLELAMCCDLVVAAESAKIGDAHANFGVYPGAGGASVLPRLIPLNVAKQLLFTGESLSAERMLAYGLVNMVVPDAELSSATKELADKIAQKSPATLRRMKAVANETHDKSRADALRHEKHEFRKHQRSYDMAEGLSAFQEKREPKFKGY